jgi:MFS family permease
LQRDLVIVFCTHCWTEIDAAVTTCAHCHADFTNDARTYSEKLVAALEHPLPEVRERMCWLIGENQIGSAIPRLMEVAAKDSDLFVRRAAFQALVTFGRQAGSYLVSAGRKSPCAQFAALDQKCVTENCPERNRSDLAGVFHMNKIATSPKGWLNRTVAGAGITSALGDFCYETTTAILPGFLAVLGLPASVLGFVEGIADAVAAFTKMLSGYIADKLGHRKLLVLVGYGLTPVGQVLIALAVGWPLLLLGRTVSWFGKGLRGPLRDAIVIQAVSPATRGRAFGFHRGADTIGAVLGPLFGVALLGWAQRLHWDGGASPFRLVLSLSVIPGILAVFAFLTLVKDPEYSPNPALKLFSSLRGLPSPFKRYLGAVSVFGIGDFSHSLLILAATTILSPSLGVIRAAQVAGLLYVWRNVVQVVVSYPVGMVADRIGHLPVLIAGCMLGALTALLTALAFWLTIGSVPLLAGIFFIAGLYVAIQEALEPTVTAEMVEPETLVMSYGALGTINGTTKLVSSAAVGVVWTAVSPALGFTIAAVLMATGTLALLRVKNN